MFLEAMRTKAGLVIDGPSDTMLDGRPAIAATFRDTICGTADIHFQGHSDMGVGSRVKLDRPSRLIFARVGGSTILVDAWATTPEALDAWLPIAQGLIDSIHFLDYPAPSPAGSGRASESPTPSRISPVTSQAAGSR